MKDTLKIFIEVQSELLDYTYHIEAPSIELAIEKLGALERKMEKDLHEAETRKESDDYDYRTHESM